MSATHQQPTTLSGCRSPASETTRLGGNVFIHQIAFVVLCTFASGWGLA